MSMPHFNVTFCGQYCGEFGWLAQKPVLKKTYGMALLFVQYGLPVILMSFCYFKILQKVKTDLVIGAYAGKPLQAQAAARKRSVMRILVLIVLAFVGSWLPLAVYNVLRDFEVEIDEFIGNQFYLVQLLSHAIAMTSVIWNPILYFWMSKSHRTAMIRKLTSSEVPGNLKARIVMLLHSGSRAVDSTSATCMLSPIERHKYSNRSSPLSTLSRVSRFLKSGDRVISSSTASMECFPTRKCSLDPFLDMNDVDSEVLKKPKKLEKPKFHMNRCKSMHSTRLPDIVRCAEEETQC